MRFQLGIYFPLLASATLDVLPASAVEERVPYLDDLTEGQGYNTFLGTGCVHGAVDVDRVVSKDVPEQVEVDYFAERITDYKQLVKSLDFGASVAMSTAAIPGMRIESSISAHILDRSELENSFLTYLVRVDVRRQPVSLSKYSFKWMEPHDANRTYCDRFISDFVKGGALFARVSIITKDETKHREVDQAAKAVFGIYGVNSEVTQAVRQRLDTIHKHSEVRIYMHYVGAKPMVQGKQPSDRFGDLLRLKETADAFLDEAKKHEWKRFAQLERYTNIPNFGGSFSPPDYAEAKDRSWSVLMTFSHLVSLQKDVRSVPSSHYFNGTATLQALDDGLTDALQSHRDWIDAVSERPEVSRVRPWIGSPSAMRAEFLRSIRRKTWIAQRLRLRNGGWTDILDETLRPGAKQLFTIKAYGFGGVPGTTRLVFGRRQGQEDSFTCLLGRDPPRNWEVLSTLWVFTAPVPGYSDETVQVSAVPQLGSIQLRHSSVGERKGVSASGTESMTTMMRTMMRKRKRRQETIFFQIYVRR
ncbi:hypothetical protein GQ602_005979 [Ophiocordyceps camponoti-floridani]|uniref:MACPF domain-containing protein n=1 Tax=Ophiocordyceps camponoti-floridani TaxID=2030778 RepID=A0A8H4VBE1_9HYPO|nr:hypothetical protein GQ602_005979 [Ophiocordyceps camponoti-floridani]